MFHTLVPAAAVGSCIAFAQCAEWRHLPFVTIAPVIYTLFALAVEKTTGFWPYFFIEQPKLGRPMFFAWMAALAMVLVAMTALVKGLRGAISRA